MTAGLLAAAAAAVCYGVASVLQAIGARRVTGRDVDLRLLGRLTQQAPYLVGLGLDLVGFVLNVVALHSLPLFLVQSVIAASVGVTAVTAIVVLRVGLHRRETVALVVLGLGLVLLAMGAKPGHGQPLARWAQWLVLGLLPVVVVAAVAVGRRRGERSAVLLAALAGAGFGAVGVAARGLGNPHPWWHAVAAPGSWAIAGFGVMAVLTFAAALQRGSVTVAAAVMSGVETVLPSVVGLAVLGDGTRPGLGVAAAVLGFALTLTGVVGLAPYAEVAAE